MKFYRDPELVRRVTSGLVENGFTVFQLFQFPGGEVKHSIKMLELVQPPKNASVLSLGCGVGGMEQVWHYYRPDLTFELVNSSAEQLKLCLCPGKTVCADAQGYVSGTGLFDCVILAYVLGHVDANVVLRSAYANLKLGGRLMIFDVFDSSPEFDAALDYNSVWLEQIEAFAVDRDMRFRFVQQGGFERGELAQMYPLELKTTPALFILEKMHEGY